MIILPSRLTIPNCSRWLKPVSEKAKHLKLNLQKLLKDYPNLLIRREEWKNSKRFLLNARQENILRERVFTGRGILPTEFISSTKGKSKPIKQTRMLKSM